MDTPALEWHCVQVAPESLPRFRICAAKYLLNDHILDYINDLECTDVNDGRHNNDNNNNNNNNNNN